MNSLPLSHLRPVSKALRMFRRRRAALNQKNNHQRKKKEKQPVWRTWTKIIVNIVHRSINDLNKWSVNSMQWALLGVLIDIGSSFVDYISHQPVYKVGTHSENIYRWANFKEIIRNAFYISLEHFTSEVTPLENIKCMNYTRTCKLTWVSWNLW